MNIEKVRVYSIRTPNRVNNHFQDIIGVRWIEDGQEKSMEGSATTLPGPTHVTNYSLVPGEYKGMYALGTYLGKKVLVQCQAVPTIRHKNRSTTQLLINARLNIINNRFEEEQVHSTYKGCQVLQYEDFYKNFINLCEKSNQKFFDYTLVEV